MSDQTSSRFLNLDLVLRSRSDLTPLATHFGKDVFVLSNGEIEGEFILALESSIDDLGFPQDYVRYFLRLIDTLPPTQRVLWDRCSSRIFDFGFQAGCNAEPCQLKLEPALLKLFIEQGLSVEITLYAHRDDKEEKSA